MIGTLEGLAALHDHDLVLEEAHDAGTAQRLKALGLVVGPTAGLDRARAALAQGLERRWLVAYDRARGRYGRGMAVVRERVCVGCFMKMPTSAVPAGDLPVQCESCARVLYWRATS